MKLGIRLAIVAAILVGGWMLVGHVVKWNAQQRLETQPRVLEQTKAAKKAKRRRLTREQAAELCSGLRVLEQTQSFVKTRRFPKKATPPVPSADGESFKLGLGDVVELDHLKVPDLPYGGEAHVELAAGADRPTVTIYPSPRPFFEAMSRFRASALVGLPLDGGSSGALVVPRIDWKAARTGRIDYGGGLVYCPARSVIGGVVFGFE